MSTDNPTFKISELPAALHAIDQLLDESGGEITPEVAALLEDYQASLADRVDGLVALIRDAQASATACRAVAEPILDRAKGLEARADRLKEYLRVTLDELGETKVKTATNSVSVCSAAPAIKIDCKLEELPEEFLEVELKPRKKALADLLRAGGELPAGVTTVVTRYLRIK